jgi:hypothetical protein
MHKLEILSSWDFDKLKKSHVLDHVVKTYKIWTVSAPDFFDWAKPVWDKNLYLDFVSFLKDTCKGDELVVVRMEKIDDDLTAFIPTPRILFDLY